MLETASLKTLLFETRSRTLDLVAPFSDAEMEAVHDPIMSPLVWDLAHIAAFEDLWLVNRAGQRPLSHPELAAMYDAFETPRAVRGSLELLNRAQAEEYMEEVRDRALDVIENEGIADDFLFEMVLRHEQQHTETMLQTIELAHLPNPPGIPACKSDESGEKVTHEQSTAFESLEVAGGPFTLGADGNSFSYDNELPLHVVDLAGFRIGRTPVNNAQYLTFVEKGGYEQLENWSREGWEWKQQNAVAHPAGWRQTADGWTKWRVDGWKELNPDEPVLHVTWYEADAFARAHGARLPTEAEWEKAATWDQNAGMARRFPWGDDPPTAYDGHANVDQAHFGPTSPDEHEESASPYGALCMVGDVWEWTASTFDRYPGFVAYPYREYSEVFFGSDYKVLRGGSWATYAEVATPTFRNWDLPQRRQIFAGFRLAWNK